VFCGSYAIITRPDNEPQNGHSLCSFAPFGYFMNDQSPDIDQERLAALSAIGAQLGRGAELDDLLNLSVETVVRLTGAENGLLLLWDEATDDLRLLVARSADPSALADNLPIDQAMVAQALHDGASVMIGESALCVPLWARGRVIGLIYVAGGVAFAPGDLAWLEAVANQTAVALENRRLQEALQVAHQAKGDFVSLVTHELRLPMTVIKGYTDLLASGMTGSLNEQQGQFVDVIKRNLGRMSQLISDLSDINRLESGRAQFEKKPFDLRDVVEDVADALRAQLAGRGQVLVVEVGEGETAVTADPRRTNQILTNLLSNAHKYTPDGGQITIQIRPGADVVTVAVQDNGLGIAVESQPRIFDQFFRSEDPAVREQVGWGLGLTVAKLLTEAQGGEISFETTYGQGSAFAFTVPYA
jgi:signal transduction histidine kinase